jgi:sugar phosphate isomerase/epimerase
MTCIVTRTAIQLTTLEDLDETIPEQIDRVSNTSLDGIEFGLLEDVDTEAIAAALDRSGLTAVGAFVTQERLENDYSSIVDTHDELDCRRCILTNLGTNPFSSESAATETARRLSKIGDRLADDDLELVYHIEFSNLCEGNKMTAFETFVEHLSPTVKLQVDTGRAIYEGLDPIVFLNRYADRIPLVHLTDSVRGGDNTRRVEVGAGELDVERCVRVVRSNDIEWIIYEHQQTNDPIDSLTHAGTLLPKLCEEAERNQV